MKATIIALLLILGTHMTADAVEQHFEKKIDCQQHYYCQR